MVSYQPLRLAILIIFVSFTRSTFLLGPGWLTDNDDLYGTIRFMKDAGKLSFHTCCVRQIPQVLCSLLHHTRVL